MKTYTIKIQAGQSIYDVAMQEYADVSGVWMLMQDNPIQCPDLNTALVPGASLIIRQEPVVADKELMNYFRTHKIEVNCAAV
jgi:hypothetical protein